VVLQIRAEGSEGPCGEGGIRDGERASKLAIAQVLTWAGDVSGETISPCAGAQDQKQGSDSEKSLHESIPFDEGTLSIVVATVANEIH